MILLVLFIPIVIGGIRYSQMLFKQRQQSIESLSDPNDAALYKECAREIALEIAKIWKPTRTLQSQSNEFYRIAERIYNSHPCLQKGGIRSAIPGLMATTTDGNKIELPPSKKKFSKNYVKISVEKNNASDKIGKIKVQTDNQLAYAVPAECNVDVVLAVPTNAGSTSYPEFGRACGELAKGFYLTRGVYVGIIPYSGKLSVTNSGWTVSCDGFPTNSLPEKIALSSLYATQKGADTSLTSYSYATSAPYPIMYRKDGSFLSTDAPSGNKRFQQMNLIPCYASPQSTKCEKGDCRTFAANPTIIELTADMEDLYVKCNAFSAISDTYNSSNFLFLPLEWANNLFKGEWNRNPKQSAVVGPETSATAILGSQDKTTSGRKKAVIFIVNKPNNFEPAEMTYLGFKNDLSEVLVKSDVIDFSANYSTGQYADGTTRNGTIEGAKKLLKFTGTTNGSGNCVLSMSQKHLLKLVVEPKAGNAKGSITFTNIKNMSSAPTTYYQNNNKCDIYERTVVVLKPEQINDNKIVEFKTENMKLVSAEMTDKTPTSETQVDCRISGEKVGTGTATITTNTKRPLTLKVVPKKTYAKVGNEERKDFKNDQFFTFQQSTPLTFEAKNATVSATATKLQTSGPHIIADREIKYGDGSNYNWNVPANVDKLTISSMADDNYCGGAGRTPEVIIKYGSTKIARFDEHIAKGYDADVYDGATFFLHDKEEGELYSIKTYKTDITIEYKPKTTDATKLYLTANWNSACGGTHSFPFKAVCTCKSESSPVDSSITGNTVNPISDQYKVTVKVSPNTLSPSITRTKPNNNGTEKQDFSGDETITIDPSKYDYVKNNGKYTVTLQLNDIEELKELDMPSKIRLFSMPDSTAPAISDSNKALSGYNGTSKDLAGLTEDAANALKNAGVRIYMIGYGYTIPDDIKAYASGNSYIYNASNETELKNKIKEIVEDIKNFAGYQLAKIVR